MNQASTISSLLMINLQSKNNAQANSLNVIDTLLIPNETGDTVLKWNLMPA